MKIFLIIITALIIIVTSSGESYLQCNLFTAKQAIPPKIFAETTIDGKDQPPLVTRYFHNKWGIFMSEFSMCYLNIFDPVFLYKNIGILGLISLLLLVYKSVIKKRYYLIIALALVPILPFFNVSLLLTIIILKLFAIIGIVFWLYF